MKAFLAGVLVVAGSMLGMFTAPAAAFNYLNETILALQSGNIYVSPEVTVINSNTKIALEEATTGTNIAVVALPEAALAESDGDIAAFVREIGARTSFDTVVLAIGSDIEAGSRSLPSGKASELAHQAEITGRTIGESLLDFVDSANQFEPSGQLDQEPDATAAKGSNIFAVVGIILLLSLGVAVFVIVRRKVSNERRLAAQRSSLPDEIARKLDEAVELAKLSGSIELFVTMSRASDDTAELFSSIGEHDRVSAIVDYTMLLGSLIEILQLRNKIAENPRYFEQSDVRIRECDREIVRFAQNVEGDIQSINRSATLARFQFNARVLSQTREEQGF